MNIIDSPALVLLLCGPIFMIAAFISKKYPPKEINQLYGYRTKSSMQSQERWDFAQAYSSELMLKMGGLLSILGIIIAFLPFNTGHPLLGIVLLIAVVIRLFYKVESTIKKRFKN